MTKTRFLYLLTTSFAVVGVSALLFKADIPPTQTAAAAGETAVPLQPARVVDIRTSLPDGYWQEATAVIDFVARPSGLYFLLGRLPRDPEDSHRMVTHTTATGGYLRAIPGLPAGSKAIDVWDEKVFVFDSGSGIEVYNARGKREATLSHPGLDEFCILGGYPLGVTRDGLVRYFQPNKTQVVGSIKDGPYLRVGPLDGNEFAIIHGTDARIYLGNAFGGIAKSFVPERTEIAKAKAAYSNIKSGHGIVLSGIATNERGDIYVVVAGAQKITEGAAVLEFTKTGELTRSLRLLSPVFPELGSPSDPAHYLAPALIEASGTELFLVDPRGLVAAYNL